MDLLNIKTLSPEASTQVVSRPKTESVASAVRDLDTEAAAPSLPKNAIQFLPWTAPVILVCGVALLLVVYLGQFASLIRTQYKVVALKDKHRLLERERIDLQLQIQNLTSLERIESMAFKQLNMTTPQQRLVLQLNPQAAVAQAKTKQPKAAPVSNSGAKD
jgi:cell division protein FtsL